MPQLPGRVIAERAARLRAQGTEALRRFLTGENGKTRRVLVERGNRGHTEHFAPVRFTHGVKAGSLVATRIIAADTDHLIAQAAT